MKISKNYSDPITQSITKILDNTNYNIDYEEIKNYKRWRIKGSNIHGCDILLKTKGTLECSIFPFIEVYEDKYFYLPELSREGSLNDLALWLQHKLIHSIYIVKNYSEIIGKLCETIKLTNFNGMCLPSPMVTILDESGNKCAVQGFEICSKINNNDITIDIDVIATETEILIKCEHDFGNPETISTDKDSKLALNNVKKYINVISEKYNPSIKYYLMLLQEPECFGEKIIVFPTKNNRFDV